MEDQVKELSGRIDQMQEGKHELKDQIARFMEMMNKGKTVVEEDQPAVASPGCSRESASFRR